MGLTDKHLYYGDDIPETTTEKDYFRYIKQLKKETVLDKIRAEIMHLHDWAFSREEILRIIDKYKAESEGGTQHDD